MEDVIKCTIRCIIENVLLAHIKTKKDGNQILEFAVHVVLKLDLQRQ